jgi:hypothetical protein
MIKTLHLVLARLISKEDSTKKKGEGLGHKNDNVVRRTGRRRRRRRKGTIQTLVMIY